MKFLWKNNLAQMIQNCPIWQEKRKKDFGSKRRLLIKTAVPPPFLNISTLYLYKSTAMPNLSTIFLFQLSSFDVQFWFSNVSHPPPPFKFDDLFAYPVVCIYKDELCILFYTCVCILLMALSGRFKGCVSYHFGPKKK